MRQGNKNEEVEIFNYVTEGTLDSYLYQIVTDKARFIAQLLDGQSPARVMEDCDERVLTTAELQAAAEGNPEFKRRIELSNEIAELKMLKSEYSHETAIVQQKIEEIPKEIELKKGILENIRKDKKTAEKIQELALSERENPKYAVVSKEAVNAHLLKMAREKSANPEKEIKPVNINGFEVSVNYDRHRDEVRFTVKGEYTYSCVAGTAEKQDNYQRIKNLFENGIPKMEQAVSDDISKLEIDFKQAEKRVAEPFSKEHELEEKVEEFEELEKKLSGISQQEDDVIDPEEEPTVETAEEMAEREKIYSVDEDDFQPTDNSDKNDANTNNIRR